MKNDVVSIIVPVYNVEKYLDRCVESIVNQTYRNLEIILVDDGSPDNCPQMCDEWAKKDSRIKVIHKENQGQGLARNAALVQAKGSYVCFVDSDDYVVQEAVQQACSLINREGADIVIFGMASENADGHIYDTSIPCTSRMIYEECAVQEQLLPAIIGPDPATGVSTGMSLSACRMLFSMELIKRADWRFVSEREIISEDGYSLIALYSHVRKAAILPKALYRYCDNQNSFSHVYRADRYQQNRNFYVKCLELCSSLGYPEAVTQRCSEPFLRNTIAALKQETVYHDRRTAVKHLRAIIDDDLLQKVLRDKKKDKANLKKRILFWAIRKRVYFLCYLLLTLKISLQGNYRKIESEKQ